MKPTLTLLFAAVCAGAVAAQEPAPKTSFSKAQQNGCDFLLKQQKDGRFLVKTKSGEFADPGFTALAISALQSKPKAERTKAEQDAIDEGAAFVLASQNEDGSVGQQVPNYTTCAAVMALSRWGGKGSEEALGKAQKFVLSIQHCETNGKARSDVDYGGVGYGAKGERSDLSNLQFAIAALSQTKLPANDEAFARAVVFLQRTQNLDGGAMYYPGESPAGSDNAPDGSLTPRSYGSMTYALLKTYTLCGLEADDPRVQAAVKWIGEHWTLSENPGADTRLGDKARYQGLFYYYMLLAQALDTMGIEKVAAKGADGKVSDVEWRKELRKQLESMQRADGSWLNERNDRWYEGLDVLCTCYALLALEHCR